MTRRKRPANLSDALLAMPTQSMLTPAQLQSLFIRHLMDADSVVASKPESLYDAKTKALSALTALVTKIDTEQDGTHAALLAELKR